MEDNIFSRLQKAYRIVASASFVKDGEVKGAASYRFISIGQILAVVRKAQAEAGITVVFGTPEYDHDQHEKRWEYTKEGTDRYTGNKFKTTWYAAVGHIPVTLFGGSKDDRIDMVIPFEAQDNSDKLTNKIVTNAERTLYRTLYSIDEGSEDPEAVNVPMMPEVSEDPFFGKIAPAAKTKTNPDNAVALDRPRETKIDTINKALLDDERRSSVFAHIKKNGSSIPKWTDAQVDAAYLTAIGRDA